MSIMIVLHVNFSRLEDLPFAIKFEHYRNVFHGISKQLHNFKHNFEGFLLQQNR